MPSGPTFDLASPAEGPIGRYDFVQFSIATEGLGLTSLTVRHSPTPPEFELETEYVIIEDPGDGLIPATFFPGGGSTYDHTTNVPEVGPVTHAYVIALRPSGGWTKEIWGGDGGEFRIRIFAIRGDDESVEEEYTFVATASTSDPPPAVYMGEAPGGIGFDDQGES